LLPILPALMIYAMLCSGLKSALRFSIVLLAIVGLFSVVMVFCFGPRELYFNMIQLPGGRPWQQPWLTPSRALLRAMWWIWRDAQPIRWLLVVAILLRFDLPFTNEGGSLNWA